MAPFGRTTQAIWNDNAMGEVLLTISVKVFEHGSVYMFRYRKDIPGK